MKGQGGGTPSLQNYQQPYYQLRADSSSITRIISRTNTITRIISLIVRIKAVAQQPAATAQHLEAGRDAQTI